MLVLLVIKLFDLVGKRFKCKALLIELPLVFIVNDCRRNRTGPDSVNLGNPRIRIRVAKMDDLRLQAFIADVWNQVAFDLPFHIEAHQDHLDFLVLKFGIGFLKIRKFFHARLAPGCPEINHIGRVGLHFKERLKRFIVVRIYRNSVFGIHLSRFWKFTPGHFPIYILFTGYKTECEEYDSKDVFFHISKVWKRIKLSILPALLIYLTKI